MKRNKAVFVQLYADDPQKAREIEAYLNHPEVRAKTERLIQELMAQREAARHYVETDLKLNWPRTLEHWRRLAYMAGLPVDLIEKGDYSPRVVIETLQGIVDRHHWLRSLSLDPPTPPPRLTVIVQRRRLGKWLQLFRDRAKRDGVAEALAGGTVAEMDVRQHGSGAQLVQRETVRQQEPVLVEAHQRISKGASAGDSPTTVVA